MDASNSVPLGNLTIGTQLRIGKYRVSISRYLAEGGFAHVYHVYLEDGSMREAVLKRIAVGDAEGLANVEKEISIMKQLNGHKNIVTYIDSQVMPMHNGYVAFILMEFCPGGGVIDLMNSRLQARLTEQMILKIFSDICEAVAHMHYCNPPILHRDLKVENILIGHNDTYKLCDFGSCITINPQTNVSRSLRDIQLMEEDIQKHTTLQYRSPEMVDLCMKKPINEKADIWALGVLLYKLCFYTTPFEDQGQLAILNARYTIPDGPSYSKELLRLIVWMLSEDGARRPTIYEVANYVFKLRGLECPLYNIYQNYSPETQQTDSASIISFTPIANGQPQSVGTHQPIGLQQHAAFPQTSNQIPPMRRGRPTRQDREKSANLDLFGSVEFGALESDHSGQTTGAKSAQAANKPVDTTLLTSAFSTLCTEDSAQPKIKITLPRNQKRVSLQGDEFSEPSPAPAIFPTSSSSISNAASPSQSSVTDTPIPPYSATSSEVFTAPVSQHATLSTVGSTSSDAFNPLNGPAHFRAPPPNPPSKDIFDDFTWPSPSSPASSLHNPAIGSSFREPPKSKPVPPVKPPRLRSTDNLIRPAVDFSDLTRMAKMAAPTSSLDSFHRKYPSPEELERSMSASPATPSTSAPYSRQNLLNTVNAQHIDSRKPPISGSTNSAQYPNSASPYQYPRQPSTSSAVSMEHRTHFSPPSTTSANSTPLSTFDQIAAIPGTHTSPVRATKTIENQTRNPGEVFLQRVGR
ncbi:uncharacterized protein VTP21DRAFT_9932 [Calcarisporiella thermophila]|uniref:uncharacterized protein n=1 Tax=Calcarisporiella thermophila TaxID=911321 RepID=UPI003744AC24